MERETVPQPKRKIIDRIFPAFIVANLTVATVLCTGVIVSEVQSYNQLTTEQKIEFQKSQLDKPCSVIDPKMTGLCPDKNSIRQEIERMQRSLTPTPPPTIDLRRR